MKLVNRKSMFFYLMCIGILFMNSCAQIPPYGEAIKIIVTPHKLSVCSGSEDTIFVKLLDKEGGPLFGMEVKAVSTSPTVATVTPGALTDATGKTTFTVKGISPGATTIVLSVAGQKAKHPFLTPLIKGGKVPSPFVGEDVGDEYFVSSCD